MDIITIIEVLTGLGIFLFGMLYMENALKEFAGVKFKKWVKNSTNTNFKAILTGASATALLQSSSVITLMTLSFVSASLISMKGGIGLIFGSNIGTTATAWLVAILGFKVKIEVFALPLVGLGGLLVMFLKNQKLIAFSKFMIGFGLLFFGLDLLKSSIEQSATHIDLADFQSYSLIVYLILGAVITALIQSSSAATAIILSSLATNIITFEMAIVMVIGTNIGTTITAFLGAIGGVADKKRLAIAHLVFNFVTAILVFITIDYFSTFILNTLNLADDTVTALAVFHTIFNLLGVLIFYPLINTISNFLEKLFIQKAPKVTKYLHKSEATESIGALTTSLKEVENLLNKTIKYNLLQFHIRPKNALNSSNSIDTILNSSNAPIDVSFEKKYHTLRVIEIEITKYLNQLGTLELTKSQSQIINQLHTANQEIVYSAKVLHASKEKINLLIEEENKYIQAYFTLLRTNFLEIVKNIKHEKNKKIAQKNHQRFIDKNKFFVDKLTKNFEKEMIDQSTVVTLLHINKTVMICSNSLFDAYEILQSKRIKEFKE